MGLQFACARVISAVSTWGLKHVFHRPAANFPGKMALYVDPQIIEHLSPRLLKGSIVVVGTNGKTTTTNLLADALEQAGQRVSCNRTGANLDSGVATALLHTDKADWGVFEADELWLAKILPFLQSNYVVLLNLFRDQLDRVGEIDRIQESIAGALRTSPQTTLIYNADDPLCTSIAQRVDNPSMAFGVAEDLHMPQNSVVDAQMCQHCATMLVYDYRQYGQLGAWRCPACGFARPTLDSIAHQVKRKEDGLSFQASGPRHNAQIHTPFRGAYMVYNVLATYVAADIAGVPSAAFQRAINAFNPENGRLQMFDVAGYRTLLNLAKNPTGFNENIKLILQDKGPKAVAFFVNDKEGDGRDISWLWDVDFEELSSQSNLRVFAGGIRKNDVQVRLKYAGLQATLVDSAAAMFSQLHVEGAGPQTRVFAIANYTALPPVHAELGRMASEGWGAPDVETAPVAQDGGVFAERVTCSTPVTEELQPLVVAHLFPDLLNLYGDGGNVKVLQQRARLRGIAVDVRRVCHGERIDFSQVDLVFLGGGPDREQRLASQELAEMRSELHTFVERDGVLLAICGGYQILGHTWLLGDEEVEGLGLVNMVTGRSEGGSANRLTGNIVLNSSLVAQPVVGYENHAGRTHLQEGTEAFGQVVADTGKGNNDTDKQDGVRYRNVLGSYLHGPLLPKNPQVADALLARALAHRTARTGVAAPILTPLDDTIEYAANEYIGKRLGI